jgi:hypothetical protein
MEVRFVQFHEASLLASQNGKEASEIKGVMMSLPEIFLVGSLWFWLLLIAGAILVFILLEWDQGTTATLTFLATLLLLQFLGNVNIYGYVVQHPLTEILGAAGYFTLGTLWAIAKWWFYVREQRSGYDELRSAFLRVHRLESPQSAVPEGLQPQWQQYLELAKRRGRSPQRTKGPSCAGCPIGRGSSPGRRSRIRFGRNS